MPDVMIVNVPPYEGEYEFDVAAQMFSTCEWRWIKKLSGYMPLTIDEGWKGGDPDLFLAFAVIAMRRAGRIAKAEVLVVAEEIEEAPFDGTAIGFRGEVIEEADPTSGSESSESPQSSGGDSSESSEPTPEAEKPQASGTQDSATGLDSDRLTLAR
jgi:hypothetical protein